MRFRPKDVEVVMYVRAYQHRDSKIVMHCWYFDGPCRDLATGEIIGISESCDAITPAGFASLEFLDWSSGKSKYDDAGHRIA